MTAQRAALGRADAAADPSGRVSATSLSWACALGVVAAVILKLASPVDTTSVVVVIPIVIAGLFLTPSTALLLVALACCGEFAERQLGIESTAQAVTDATGFLVAVPVCLAIGTRLGTRGLLQAAPGPAPLSRRQAEVVDLVLEGLSARQIARRLSLTDRTVESHTSNAYAKLGVHDRASLMALYRPETPPETPPARRRSRLRIVPPPR